jgi:hypothetical protein
MRGAHAGPLTARPQWRDQAKTAVRVASWGALGRGTLTRAIHDDWTDVRNDRSQPSPASGGVVSAGGEAAEAQAVQLTSKLSSRPPHGP